MKQISFEDLLEVAKDEQLFYATPLKVQFPWETVSNQGEAFEGMPLSEFMTKAALAHTLGFPIAVG